MLLLQLFGLAIGLAQIDKTAAELPIATGTLLDPDQDLWWVDKHNLYSSSTFLDLLSEPCDSQNVIEARFRYYNNSAQVYVRMTKEEVFMEFWYPNLFWSGSATTAQILKNEIPNTCHQCIAQAGKTLESYDFELERANSPNNNCWDECIGSNTFLNTANIGDNLAFLEASVIRDSSVVGQPREYQLSHNLDLQLTHTSNRRLELVLVSQASAYDVNGELIHIGATAVPYVHGCSYREWSNPSGNEWISPFLYDGVANPWNFNFRENTCFTWIASDISATGNLDTINGQFLISKAGIVCPEILQCSNDNEITSSIIKNRKLLSTKRAKKHSTKKQRSRFWRSKAPTKHVPIASDIITTAVPTASPTRGWIKTPTGFPTAPLEVTTKSPTEHPTIPWFTPQPTGFPTAPLEVTTRSPTEYPTPRPTSWHTPQPTGFPTAPLEVTTKSPTEHPTISWFTPQPTKHPIQWFTPQPTGFPTAPLEVTTRSPTEYPTPRPTSWHTPQPTGFPTAPLEVTTKSPTEQPTKHPIQWVTPQPTGFPTAPLEVTTRSPTEQPTKHPIKWFTPQPTGFPTAPLEVTTRTPTELPTKNPTYSPTKYWAWTKNPTYSPTKYWAWTKNPTRHPTGFPTAPLEVTTRTPTEFPTKNPTEMPTKGPTELPTKGPTLLPTKSPTELPTKTPTYQPTKHWEWTKNPTRHPTGFPTAPLEVTTRSPTEHPTKQWAWTNTPTKHPTPQPIHWFTPQPTGFPTAPLEVTTRSPTEHPTKFWAWTQNPTKHPTGFPTAPLEVTTRSPTEHPTKQWAWTNTPTKHPTPQPIHWFTPQPTGFPTAPLEVTTRSPTEHPTKQWAWTKSPTKHPTGFPTAPLEVTTRSPTDAPTDVPTPNPTAQPSVTPTARPSARPTAGPTDLPTVLPTLRPSARPTAEPTVLPTVSPTARPSARPTVQPTDLPTASPSARPTARPTISPTTLPPTMRPTLSPTVCIPPPPPPAGEVCTCEATHAEWKLDLTDYMFEIESDRTYIQYEVCVYARNPSLSCNPADLPVPLDKLMIQIPCNCDLCIDIATQDMIPNGHTSELDRGWIWDFKVAPGECQTFELVVQGHATLKLASYQLIGMDERCVNNFILVPDICEQIRPAPSRQWSWSAESHNNTGGGDECPRDPLMIPDMCTDMCDDMEGAEWSIEFESSTYDENTQTTTFTWNVTTSIDLPDNPCNAMADGVPMPLTDVTLRLGCDCEPQSLTYLRSLTDVMNPAGVVHNNYWHFDNLNVLPGESQELQLVLKGDWSGPVLLNFGDATLAGADHRCASTLTSNSGLQVVVPNPCAYPCAFGEWTPWQIQGECSAECGGGEQIRSRTCISICGETPVDNCPGEAYGTVPCNTQPCPGTGPGVVGSSSSSSSSDDHGNSWWHH